MNEGDGPCISNLTRLARAILWFYIQQLTLLYHNTARGPHLDPLVYEKAHFTNVVPNTKLLASALINITVKFLEQAIVSTPGPLEGESVVFANGVQPSKLDELPRRLVWGALASIALGRREARQHDLSRGGFSLWT